MRLLRSLLHPFEARRAAEAEGDIRRWHTACEDVIQTCIQALRDPQLPRGDIGVTLDRVDRTLFRLRDAGSGAEGALRRRNRELGRRIRQVSEAIVELRNQTVQFLIRAQGPNPAFLGVQTDPARIAESYQRAKQDVGQAAGQHAAALERDLRQLWTDLQPILLEMARSVGRT
jgi:tRNA U54 and U55 pseudouridine synthase Pus10